MKQELVRGCYSKHIKEGYRALAMAIIKSAVRDKDEAFFQSDWGVEIMTIAGVGEVQINKMKEKRWK